MEPFFTIAYHGTGIDNAKDILINRQGLQINSPLTTSGRGTPAVYLTPNIKLAARYALGGLSTAPLNRTPAILEIKLFGQRRYTTSMRSDPLDRDDSAWSDHYDDGGFSHDSEVIREIDRDIERFVQGIAQRYKLASPPYIKSIADEIEALQGFPLHRYIHQIIARMAGPRYSQIKNDVSRFLNSGHLGAGNDYEGLVAITNSGTLQLTPQFWDAQHQTLYRKKIPASAVKAVWVREKDFPHVVGKKEQFGAELLPQEVVDEFESKKHKLENLGDEANGLISKYLDDPEDKDYYVGELEELKKDMDDDKIVDLIDQLIHGMDDEDFDFDPVLDELGQRGNEMASYLYDDYMPGTAVEIEKNTVWVRVETQNARSLFKV